MEALLTLIRLHLLESNVAFLAMVATIFRVSTLSDFCYRL